MRRCLMSSRSSEREEYAALRRGLMAQVRRGGCVTLPFEDREDVVQDALLAGCRRRAAGEVRSCQGLARKALHDVQVDRMRKPRAELVELDEAEHVPAGAGV